jgi:hypothetical protein
MRLERLTVLALCGLLATVGGLWAGDQDFVLVNKTGVEIHALYVSASGEDKWGEDILGRDTLPDGAQVEIRFSPKEKAALWDVRVEDEDGGSIEWKGLNLLAIGKVTLNFNKKSGKATASVEAAAPVSRKAPADQDFVLVNKTGVEIHAMYVSASGQDEWGEDILGQDTLPDGGQVAVKFHPKERAALWDVRVEDGDGTAIEWKGLNLLEIAKVTLSFTKGGKPTARVE